MTEDIRTHLLGPVKYEPVECPDAGTIQMLPYISAGAMEVIGPPDENSKQAFADFYKASVQEGAPDFASLTEADVEAIAAYYMAIQGCLDEFTARCGESDVFSAFHQAFCSTEAWKQWDRDRRRLLMEIQAKHRLWTGGIGRHIAAAMSVVRHMERIRVPIVPYVDRADWLAERRLLLETTASQLRPSITASLQIQRSIESTLGIWNKSVVTVHDELVRGPLIQLRQQNLEAMMERSRAVSDILQAVRPFEDAIARTVELTKLGIGELDSIGATLRDALRMSGEIVSATSHHFSTTDRPRFETTPVYPDQAKDLREADEQVEEFYEQSETLLHEDASETIIVTNDTLLLVREQFASAIDERLAPYTPVLDRLAYLSRPDSFMEVLKKFSHSFGNLHWKALWETSGSKFKPKPEEIAQSILASHLEGICHGIAFVGREIGSGDGYVDLLVNFLGYDYIVEIKIVGGSWSIGSAKKGLDQLDHYMMAYEQPQAFLVVFDGRTSDKGEQLSPSYQLDNGTVQVVTVKSYFKAPTT